MDEKMYMQQGGIEMSIIVAHGGAETSTGEAYIKGLESAVLKGDIKLQNGCGGLDSIEAVVNELEDNPLYNAGFGSVLNYQGVVELDASIMNGENGEFGSVAALKGIRHAISVAKKVMKDTDNLLLAGEGALKFALDNGFRSESCIIPAQLESWVKASKMGFKIKNAEFSLSTGMPKGGDTVGCVLLDDNGNLAAGNSTGGLFLKRPGRVGDAPFIGGGIISSKYCSVVCTGTGEAFAKTLTAKYIDDCIREGVCPEDAGCKAIKRMYAATGKTGGVLILDYKGRTAAVHNCSGMPVALINGGKQADMEIIKLKD
jgi:beta-aspartyl-peptidase (threonine type)